MPSRYACQHIRHSAAVTEGHCLAVTHHAIVPPMAEKTLSEHLAELGRKGGRAKNAKLSPAQRKKNASKAARSRWSKEKKKY